MAKNPENEAGRVLIEFEVTEPPIPVEEIASSLAQVSFRPLQGDVSGVLFREEDGGEAVVGINSADSPQRQRFTMAHEIGHLRLHKGRPLIVDKLVRVNLRGTGNPTLASPSEEREANRFAAELLMPKAMVKRQVAELVGERALISDRWLVEKLAERFDVSGQAMEYRLMNLGIFSELGVQAGF